MAQKQQRTEDRPAEGVVWVSSTGGVWKETDVTVDKLRKYADNIYGDGISDKQMSLTFPGKAKVEVLDESNEKDPELTTEAEAIAKRIKLDARIRQAYYDNFWYGCGIFNPVFEWVENEYVWQEINYRPAWSFCNAPQKQYKAISSLLHGIILNQDDEVEYWQTQSDTSTTPIQLKNIITVQNPVISDLGGRPIIKSSVPVIVMLDYLWNAQMQRGRRVGSPLLFIKIIEAKTAAQRGGKLSDVEYAKLFLRKWGKDTGFTLRDNMELVDPHITDKADNLATIKALNEMITQRFSPSSWISISENRLGGSDTAGFDLLSAYISGIHAWLEEPFENLYQIWLDENGYVGYHVDITLPLLQQDKTEQNIAKVEKGKDDLTLNERRKLLDHAPADDATRTEIEAERSTRAASQTVSPFGNVARKPDPDLGKADKITAKYNADLEDLTRSYARRIATKARQTQDIKDLTLEANHAKKTLVKGAEGAVEDVMKETLTAGAKMAEQYLKPEA